MSQASSNPETPKSDEQGPSRVGVGQMFNRIAPATTCSTGRCLSDWMHRGVKKFVRACPNGSL